MISTQLTGCVDMLFLAADAATSFGISQYRAAKLEREKDEYQRSSSPTK